MPGSGADEPVAYRSLRTREPKRSRLPPNSAASTMAFVDGQEARLPAADGALPETSRQRRSVSTKRSGSNFFL